MTCGVFESANRAPVKSHQRFLFPHDLRGIRQGPAIATGIDPGRLDIATRLNGEVNQKSNTSDLIFGLAKLVSYLSDAITPLPGDVIITGTPAGIGPMQPGDVVEIDIQHIGVLRNPVVAE